MRRRTPQDQLDAERAQLDALLEAEYEQRTAELKRALASSRAELTSMLQEESRRLGEEWRVEFAERERRAAAEYSMRLVQVQKHVEDRLTAWAHDLERTTGEIESQVGRLEALQKERLAKVERSLTQEAEALRAESDEQRVAVLRLREEVQNAAAEAIKRRRTSSSRWLPSGVAPSTRSGSGCGGANASSGSRSSARRSTRRSGSPAASPRLSDGRRNG